MSDGNALAGLVGLRVPEAPPTDLLAAFGIGLCVALIALSIVGLLWASGRRVTRSDPHPDREDLSPARKVIVLAERLRERTDAEAPGTAPWPDRAVAALGLPADVAAQLGADLYAPRPPDKEAALATQLAAVLTR